MDDAAPAPQQCPQCNSGSFESSRSFIDGAAVYRCLNCGHRLFGRRDISAIGGGLALGVFAALGGIVLLFIWPLTLVGIPCCLGGFGLVVWAAQALFRSGSAE